MCIDYICDISKCLKLSRIQLLPFSLVAQKNLNLNLLVQIPRMVIVRFFGSAWNNRISHALFVSVEIRQYSLKLVQVHDITKMPYFLLIFIPGDPSRRISIDRKSTIDHAIVSQTNSEGTSNFCGVGFIWTEELSIIDQRENFVCDYRITSIYRGRSWINRIPSIYERNSIL